jgi:hypothetical protein
MCGSAGVNGCSLSTRRSNRTARHSIPHASFHHRLGDTFIAFGTFCFQRQRLLVLFFLGPFWCSGRFWRHSACLDTYRVACVSRRLCRIFFPLSYLPSEQASDGVSVIWRAWMVSFFSYVCRAVGGRGRRRAVVWDGGVERLGELVTRLSLRG